MGRTERITKLLKTHDYKLYCEKNGEGTLCVFREGHSTESYALNNDVLTVVRPTPDFVFALTDTWKAQGRAVDWGLEPIMARIKEIDLWKRDIAAELSEQYDKNKLSKKRDFKNRAESFLFDYRSQFARTFNDVNTSTLKKIDNRRNSKWQL